MRYRSLRFAILSIALLIASQARAQESLKDTAAGGEEHIQFLRSNGVVYGAIVRDESGSEIRRETYLRISDGSVVEIIMCMPDGSVTRLGVAGDRQWVDASIGQGLYRTYFPDGRLRIEEERMNGSVQWRDAYRYEGSPPYLASITRDRPSEGSRQERIFGSGGLLARETNETKGSPTECLFYSYDEQKRLAEIKKLVGRAETRIRFSYGPDGSETEERFDATGALVLRIRKDADGTALEEHFDAGILFARIRFRDGRKISQEMVPPGETARSRESP